MTTRKCDYHPYIDDYIDDCRNGKNVVGNEILLACDLLERKLNDPNVFIDSVKINKAVELMEKYFKQKLFDWELLIVACIHCYYKSDNTLVFTTFKIIMGRGNGKNGFISMLAWYLTTHYHGIRKYNIDIVANSEAQAKTSFEDIYEMLENTWDKSKNFFYKSKEVIRNLRTGSYIKFNTSNPKSKDGLRPACVIFDEEHQYEDYKQINVFLSAFGKKQHTRAITITTDGDVREGVIDDDKALIEDVLNGTITDLRMLPLYYKISNEAEGANPDMWHKANPSLKYLPTLQLTMHEESIQMKYKPEVEQVFYTKRLNWPRGNRAIQVATWDDILGTNKPLPDLTGWSCSAGIDYASMNDWAGVNLHFKRGDERFDISHAWMCMQSPFLSQIKAPYERWAEEGHVTLVDDVEISPELLAEYFAEAMTKYNILAITCDNYRYALLAAALRKLGFDANNKDSQKVYLIRPSDIAKVQPIIQSCFLKQYFAWGDNPVLRWSTNNTKLEPSGKKEGAQTGTFYYAKISHKSRKNDPFMALVASMTKEDLLGDGGAYDYPDIDVQTY